jgi:hypothetical protein
MVLNYKQVQEALANRQEFKGNSMSARYHSVGDFSPQHGRLCEDEIVKLEKAWKQVAQFQCLYVVSSYATPIAWALTPISPYGMRSFVPAHLVDQKFSVTTSKGQGYVKRNIDRYTIQSVFAHEKEAV